MINCATSPKMHDAIIDMKGGYFECGLETNISVCYIGLY